MYRTRSLSEVPAPEIPRSERETQNRVVALFSAKIG